MAGGLENADAAPFAERILVLIAHLGATYRLLEPVVRRDQIGCVWAPAYEGGHQDHDTASFLASLLSPAVPVWEFKIQQIFKL